MDDLAAWSKLVARTRSGPPLSFVSGVRLPIRRGVSCGVHSHATIEIVYHAKGSGYTRMNGGRSLEFAEGSVVVYAPNERHDQVMHDAGEDRCVTVAVPARYRDVPQRCFGVVRLEDPAIRQEIDVLSEGRVKPTPTEQAILNLRATAALYVLVQLACARGRNEEDKESSERYVEKAEQYIREHHASIGSLREVAAHCGISYDHLRHVVKAVRGRSLVRYLTEVRVERARTLLANSGQPLKQIATICGFRDEYYFSAVFRGLVGSPPGHFRRRQAGGKAVPAI